MYILHNHLYLRLHKAKQLNTYMMNMRLIKCSKNAVCFAWATSTPDMGEVQRALYKITGKAFDLSFDEEYDPIFTEWGLKDPISVSYYYDALYEEFNK